MEIKTCFIEILFSIFETPFFDFGCYFWTFRSNYLFVALKSMMRLKKKKTTKVVTY